MRRQGIFGGTFNPIHLGHLNSMKTVLNYLGLEKLVVIPAFQNPMLKKTDGPSAEERLKMVEETLLGVDSRIEVDPIEIERKGLSYTVETIEQLNTKEAELFLIIGMDQFEHFDQWKDFTSIIDQANLVVTSRPKLKFPKDIEDIPEGLKSLVENIGDKEILLSSGKTIRFIQLDDLPVSSTDIRARLRKGLDVSHLLPEKTLDFIHEHNLYEPLTKSIDDFRQFTQELAEILISKNAHRVRAYDLSALVQPAEYTVIASGTSARHARSLAEFLIKDVRNTYKLLPVNTEGVKEGRWAVVDYGGVIVHIFYDYAREQYRLEELWEKGEEIPLTKSQSQGFA